MLLLFDAPGFITANLVENEKPPKEKHRKERCLDKRIDEYEKPTWNEVPEWGGIFLKVNANDFDLGVWSEGRKKRRNSLERKEWIIVTNYSNKK